MKRRRSRSRRIATVILRRKIWRNARNLFLFVVDLPNSPLFQRVQERRDIDEIRGFYPMYKTPKNQYRAPDRWR
jgi:hypothetical protein